MQEQLLCFAEIEVGLAGLASGVQEGRKRGERCDQFHRYPIGLTLSIQGPESGSSKLLGILNMEEMKSLYETR